MKTLTLGALFAFALATCAQAQCNGLVAVVNGSNTSENLSAPQVRKLLLGDIRTWPGGKPVTVVSPTASSAVYKCILQQVLRMTATEYQKYLLGAEFRGEEPVPVVTGDYPDGVARMILKNGGGITLVDAALAKTLPPGVKTLKINGKSPGEAGYPF